jgi:hypothetical protein
VQATGAGIEPEMALVIELASDLVNFAAAARHIGLEWLAEDEIDLDPSETIFLVDAKGQRQDKAISEELRTTRWAQPPKTGATQPEADALAGGGAGSG